MKETGILMKPFLIEAIMNTKLNTWPPEAIEPEKPFKGMTRRMKGLDSKNEHPDKWHREGNPMKNTCRLWDSTKEADPNPIKVEWGFKHITWKEGDDIAYVKCPYGKPGDLLYVKETFVRKHFYHMYNPKTNGEYYYKLDCDEESLELAKEYGYKWKSPLFMPKAAARIWLQITDIKPERLQDISEEDSIIEGIEPIKLPKMRVWRDYYKHPKFENDKGGFVFAYASFQSLINFINGPKTWDQNPWVWVISFKVLSTTGRPELITDH